MSDRICEVSEPPSNVSMPASGVIGLLTCQSHCNVSVINTTPCARLLLRHPLDQRIATLTSEWGMSHVCTPSCTSFTSPNHRSLTPGTPLHILLTPLTLVSCLVALWTKLLPETARDSSRPISVSQDSASCFSVSWISLSTGFHPSKFPVRCLPRQRDLCLLASTPTFPRVLCL